MPKKYWEQNQALSIEEINKSTEVTLRKNSVNLSVKENKI